MHGTWTHELIAGKPADVYQPPGADRPRFGLLFLHPVGNETLRGRPAFTRWLDTFAMPCVCPLAPYTWWADRVLPEFDPVLTAERHLLDNVLPYFAAHWNLRPRSIGVAGISMGGQGALRLAFKHPRMFPVVTAIASALDYHELYGSGYSIDAMYDSKEQCRQDTATMHVPPHDPPPQIFFCIDPEDDDWLRGNDRLHEKLNALGVPHTLDMTTTAGGHCWDYFNRMAEPVLRFVADGLQQESLRLL